MIEMMIKIYAVTLLTGTGLLTARIPAYNRLAARIRAKQLYRPCLVLWDEEAP